MCDFVARTGRLQQRYEDGCRLVAGCIPFRYRNPGDGDSDSDSEKVVQVLMISSSSGPGLLFPKGGWENDETVEEAAAREAVEEAGVRGILMVKHLRVVPNSRALTGFAYASLLDCLPEFLQGFVGDYQFKSKTHQDEFSPEGICRASMYALQVKEELESWPEQDTRTRAWLTIPEAVESCRHAWMKDALEQGFCKWLQQKKIDRGEFFNF